MFTGIVEARVRARSFAPAGSGARLVLPAPTPDWSVLHGESVAVSGCCLTVARQLRPGTAEEVAPGTPGADMLFELSAETLARTWFAAGLDGGRALNLERSLRPTDRLGGHIVQGHVDGTGRVAGVRDAGDGGRWIDVEVAAGFERYLIEKGSVAVDGISLTVVEPRGRRFSVAVIPVTLGVTSLGSAAEGDPVHLEADVVGKWVERMLEARGR